MTALSAIASSRPPELFAGIPQEPSAQAALWLCGPGSQSINGQTIEIAGGQC